jgi:hypothetical protein
MKAILRPDYSSYHLVVFNPQTGEAKEKLTNQGYKDDSTWTRGQAWSIMGFAQTYTWTKDLRFLETAIKCAQYFLKRLEECKGKHHHHLVPAWDFDAPYENQQEPLRDASAGVIAANGLFIIHQSLQSLPPAISLQLLAPAVDFLDLALKIVGETLDMALDRDFASFEAPVTKIVNGTAASAEQEIRVRESGFEAILRYSTANHNEHAHKRHEDHGLVYADYFLLEFGNKLLRAGLV